MLSTLTRTIRRFASKSSHLVKDNQLVDNLLKTLGAINRASSVTLGPMGRLVAIENELGPPRVTKDGVTVVKHIDFQQRLDNAIANLIKNAANNANKFSGDGTTTTTLLSCNIVKQALSLAAFNVNQKKIRQGLNIAKDIALELIDEISRPIQQGSDLLKVALISTNNDQPLSRLISEALSNAAEVKVEKSKDLVRRHYLQYVEGTKITRGIPHEMLVNKLNKIEFNYPVVVVYSGTINNVNQIVGPLEKARKMKKQLMIFAQDFSESVSSMLYYNHAKKIVECCPIKIPGIGDFPKDLLHKIATITDSYLFGATGHDKTIQDIDFKDLGSCIKVTVDEFETHILSKSNKAQKHCVLYVGGTSESETLQIYDKAVDGLNSVRTARQKGVVPGGGISYLRCAEALSFYNHDDPDVNIGVKCLARALRTPFRHLMALSEMEYARETSGWQGYDFKTKELVGDMFERGIVDSAAVARNCIIDSVSLGGMLLSLDLAIVLDLEYKESQYSEYKDKFKM